MVSSDERPPSADRVPTLTEVVELGPDLPPLPAWAAVQEPALHSPSHLPELGGLSLDYGATWAAPDLAPLPEAQPVSPPQHAATLVKQVLQELAPRIDLLFEAQLRDALAPALARAADGLVRDAREDVSAALRALVEQAVARALEHRQP